jgi:hypothetical protein
MKSKLKTVESFEDDRRKLEIGNVYGKFDFYLKVIKEIDFHSKEKHSD